MILSAKRVFGRAGWSAAAAISAAALVALAAVFTAPARAADATIAVAANFTEPARAIAAVFRAKTGRDVALSFGASGAFYTQIRQGAPFDAMLSADGERPRKLADEGLGVAGSRFVYATGKLALWTRASGAAPGEATLREGKFEKLAIANPLAAPYGAAAIEVMRALGVEDALRPKRVEGASIGQAFQFAETGNAEFAFVALSQTIGKGGSLWLAPPNLHTPIRQEALLLKAGQSNETAKAFLDFLKGPEARALIVKYGYDPSAN